MTPARRVTAAILGLLLALSWAGLAYSHDHEPPSSRLESEGKHQKGYLIRSCWMRADGDPGFFVFICADGFRSWPRARVVPAGSQATVRFRSEHEPFEVSLAYWRRIGKFDIPKGDPRSLEAEVVPVMADGAIVAYDAVLTLPPRPGQFYLDVFATWPDQEGTEALQDAMWSYHLKLE